MIGPTGQNGLIGPTGQNGLTGPTGQNGLTGPTGPTGLIGPTGQNGLTGPTGQDGNVGPTGVIGPTGQDGLLGPTGPTGSGSSCQIVNSTFGSYVSVCDSDIIESFAGEGFIFSNNIFNPVIGPSTSTTGFFFNSYKSAFRSGSGDSVTWNSGDVGIYSSAFGNNIIASGQSSFATGESTNDIVTLIQSITNGKYNNPLDIPTY